MISESRFWKADLLRWAEHLERRTKAQRWSEASTARVERAVMFGFFALRRLIESKGRLCDSTVQRRMRLKLFPSKSRHVTLLNWHKLDRHFALASPRTRTLGVEDLCNQFIHSYVFSLVLGPRLGLHSFLVASDRGRKRALYEVAVRTIVTLFRLAGRDYPNAVDASFDSSIEDFRVTARLLPAPGHAA